jgi:HEAT repeat protein
LIQALNDSDDWARLSAAHALGMFGTDAKSAVPALTEMTNVSPLLSRGIFSTRLQAMLEARNALRKIDPPVVWPTSESFLDYGVPAEDAPISPR